MINVKTNESGRSMIEMLGVLAIIGVLSVGGIAGYSKAMMKFKINKTLDQIAMTVTNIRTMYAQQNNYSGLNNALAISLGMVDEAMGKSGSALNSPFGAVSIGTDDAGTIAGNTTTAFTITLNNVPKEACVAIATNSWGSAFSAGFLGIAVSSTTGASTSSCTITAGANTNGVGCSFAASSTTSGALISVARAASNCASATGNSIQLKYY